MRLAPFILSGLLLGAIGCVRAGFDPTDKKTSGDLAVGPPDALSKDTAEVDRGHDTDGIVPDDANIGGDLGTIAPLAPFGPAQRLGTLSSQKLEDDPTLTGDMTEIYFDRSGDIWRATRASSTAPWSAPSLVAELNSSASDGAPEISADGLVIYLASARQHPQAKGDLDIYRSHRASRSQPWSTPGHVADLSSSEIDADPVVAQGELNVVMSSNLAAGTSVHDLYESSRASSSSQWGPLQPLTAVNTASADYGPWLDPTRTVLYFASNRKGVDLWVAQRAQPGAAFSAPQLLSSVNTTSDELDPWLSPDQRTLYFASDRDGNRDLYVAER